MSSTPQGPGWWQASDGRWYPPPAQPGAPHQHFAPGAKGHGFTGPPPKKSGAGKVLLVLGVVLVLAVVGGAVAVSMLLNRVTENVIGGNCDLVGVDDVNSTLAGEFELIQLGGLTSIATPALDSRVLADGTTCWATESGSETPRLVRVAKLDSGDAAARFQQERTLAQGVKEDRGGGVTVESEPYFNRDVDGAGDEAFCTTTDMTGSSGVLVRRGDALIYVSMTSGTFSPDLTGGADGSIKSADDDAHCDLAQRIAEQVG